jgi:simple sugar transport system ATP-binding protein
VVTKDIKDTNLVELAQLMVGRSVAIDRVHSDKRKTSDEVVLSVKNLNDREIREHAERMIKDLDIRCKSPLQSTGSLSGGNQQKVCVARALTQKPQFLFVSEPTRGIDIGAKKLILDLLLKLNEEYGMTIVMTSSELAELRSICDKIVIICAGAVAGVLPPGASDADFGLMMSGSKVKGSTNE